ncbi:MAG: flavin reductase [Candidatus Marinimicrobia bacterium]|nr:flavin reductase [Candidatus Neomarinimicrobiota bacterium]
MNEKDKKIILKQFSYGIFIMTATYNEEYCASTVTWVSQASFDPPLLSVCIKRDSKSYQIVSQSKSFILHSLDSTQKKMASDFFKPTQKVGELLNDHPFTLLDSSSPVLTECPAYLRCTVKDILDYGDHPLFLANILDAVVIKDYDALDLKSAGWSYGG